MRKDLKKQLAAMSAKTIYGCIALIEKDPPSKWSNETRKIRRACYEALRARGYH